MIEVVEETGNDLINRLKKAVEKRAIRKKKGTQFFSNGKDTVAMRTTNQLERHSGGTFYSVKSTTGGTEAAVTAERHKLGVSAFATAIKSTTKGWIPAMDHL